MRAAITSDTRVSPVEENQERMAARWMSSIGSGGSEKEVTVVTNAFRTGRLRCHGNGGGNFPSERAGFHLRQRRNSTSLPRRF